MSLLLDSECGKENTLFSKNAPIFHGYTLKKCGFSGWLYFIRTICLDFRRVFYNGYKKSTTNGGKNRDLYIMNNLYVITQIVLPSDMVCNATCFE